MNILSEDNSQLACLDYRELLQAIVNILDTENPFQWSGDKQRLNINIDAIAKNIAEKKLTSPLIISHGMRSATLEEVIGSAKDTRNQIRQIEKKLIERLEISADGENAKDKLKNLVKSLSRYKSDNRDKLSFRYQFPDNQNLIQKKSQILKQSEKNEELLKLNIVKVKVKGINEFTENLKNSIKQNIDSIRDSKKLDEDDLDDLEEMYQALLKEEDSQLYTFRDIVYQETIGKIKKKSKILYLEYLYNNLKISGEENIISLEDYIRRIRLLNLYINNPNEPDGKYEVSYEGTKINYREHFARSESLDKLPIIPMIEGNLGESSREQKSEKEFIFCIRMKLNGAVTSQSTKKLNSLEYHLQILNPESSEHKNGLNNKKILQICLLYYFVFASKNENTICNQKDLEYDPVANFDQHILPILTGNDEEAKRNIFRGIIKGFKKYKVKEKVDDLKKTIKTAINLYQIIEPKTWSIKLVIEKAIIETPSNILDKKNFFRFSLNNNKEYLRYITVTSQQTRGDFLSELPVDISIEDIRYYSTEETKSISQQYNLKNIECLPIILWNYEDERIKKIYSNNFQAERPVSIRYNNKILKSNISNELFFYKFTFSLLTYLSLKIIAEKIKENNKIFFPIIRLQNHDQENDVPDETYIRNFSKTLCHLLSQDILANSQGINIKTISPYKIQNSLSSLYSVLPKIYELKETKTEISKLAVIIISSRECDRKYDDERKILSVLFGEIITIKSNNNKIFLENRKTFSANFEKQEMYKRPGIVVDQINELYQEGYRHILYIAKAPFSSNLNLIYKDDDNFFMSKNIMKAIKGDKLDLNIYPIFFDKYPIKKKKPVESSISLYIKDTPQINNMDDDHGKKTVVFLNLFNGISVGNEHERLYNSVISYSTLLNSFQEILDEQSIRSGLINDSDNNQVKTDILNYLILVHYVRYERDSKPNIKLDPYEEIIGEESVGSHSIFLHTDGRTSFNSLAYLTEIKNILNIKNK